MKEITGKSKFEIKKLPHRIVINEKEVIGEKQLRENSITFFVNIGYWNQTSFEKYECQTYILKNMLI